MMGIVEFIVALGSISGLAIYVAKKMEDTPAERKRKSMVKLDKALDHAKKHHDPEEIAKWFGERLH